MPAARNSVGLLEGVIQCVSGAGERGVGRGHSLCVGQSGYTHTRGILVNKHQNTNCDVIKTGQM